MDKAQFSAVAPKALLPGEYAVIDRVMYRDAFRHVVDELLSDADAPIRETRAGAMRVAQGAARNSREGARNLVYAMADIHGEYEKYRRMLEQICFSPEDELYVLGDVVDRGPQPVELLRDMAARDNVFPLMGNHDVAALDLLDRLAVEITEENCETQLDADVLMRYADWLADGGGVTANAFRALSFAERADLLDYLRDFAPYEALDVGERSFLLVHAGLRNFDEKRPLSSYRLDELILGRHDFARQYFPDPAIYVVTGHTPTLAITGKPEIYRQSNNIAIDCGACFPGGRLACLCLDTMEEYYV